MPKQVVKGVRTKTEHDIKSTLKSQEHVHYLEVRYSDNLDNSNYQCNTLKYRARYQLIWLLH
jgi:hypothetical protein